MVYYLKPAEYGLEVSMKSAKADYRVVGIPVAFFLLVVILINLTKPAMFCDTAANGVVTVNKMKTLLAGVVAAVAGVAVVMYGIKEESVA